MILKLILILSVFTALRKAEETFNLDEYTLTWTDEELYTNFVFVAKLKDKNDKVYATFGLSLDDKIGDDQLILFKYDGDYSIEHYFFAEEKAEKINPNNLFLGLNDSYCEIYGDELTCFFLRRKSLPGYKKYYSLSNGNKYYVTFSQGDLMNGTVNFEDELFLISKNSISFIIDNSVKLTTNESPLESTTEFQEDNKRKEIKSDEFALEWDSSDSQSTNFVFYEKVLNNDLTSNKYIAFGLSKDAEMGDDSVIICKWFNGTGSIEHYYNVDKSNPIYLDEQSKSIGLSDMNVWIENGFLKCTFKREDSNKNNSKYFDLNEKHFVLIARGSVDNGKLSFHNDDGFISENLIDFKLSEEFQSTSTVMIETTKGNEQKYDNVDFYWMRNGSRTKFEIFESQGVILKRQITVAEDKFVALGISLDSNMGNDCVVLCKITNGTGSIEHFFINWRNQITYYSESKKSLGIRDVNVTIQNGALYCSFTRENSIQGIDNFYDISNQSYYVYGIHGLDILNLENFIGKMEITKEKVDFSFPYVVVYETYMYKYDYRMDMLKKAFNNLVDYIKNLFSRWW